MHNISYKKMKTCCSGLGSWRPSREVSDDKVIGMPLYVLHCTALHCTAHWVAELATGLLLPLPPQGGSSA
jgi:hypothetical protein